MILILEAKQFGLPNYDHDGMVEVVYGKFNWQSWGLNEKHFLEIFPFLVYFEVTLSESIHLEWIVCTYLYF